MGTVDFFDKLLDWSLDTPVKRRADGCVRWSGGADSGAVASTTVRVVTDGGASLVCIIL